MIKFELPLKKKKDFETEKQKKWFTFDVVPEEVAVGIGGRDEGDGVAHRVRLHDVGAPAVVLAELRRAARVGRRAQHRRRHPRRGVARRLTAVRGPHLSRQKRVPFQLLPFAQLCNENAETRPLCSQDD